MYLNENLQIIKKLIQITGNYYQLFDSAFLWSEDLCDQGKCYWLRQITLIKICIIILQIMQKPHPIILLIYCSNLFKIIIQAHLSVPLQIKDTKGCLVYSVADNLQIAVVIRVRCTFAVLALFLGRSSAISSYPKSVKSSFIFSSS